MATESRDITSLYPEDMDIYHDIISTIEKRSLSGYDIFLQTHFWILYPIIYHIFVLDINIPNISLNRIYIRDIISLDIYPSQVCLHLIHSDSPMPLFGEPAYEYKPVHSLCLYIESLVL